MNKRDLSFRLGEIERRLANMIRVGVVCEVFPEEGLCRVDFGPRKTGKIPYLTPRAGDDKIYFHPDIGEQALVFSPFGDERWGFALVGIFSTQKPLPEGSGQDKFVIQFKDGTRMEYDRAKSSFTFTHVQGTSIRVDPSGIEINTPKPVTISAVQAEINLQNLLKLSANMQEAQISVSTLNGDMQILGNLVVTGTIMSAAGITSGGPVCAQGGLQTSPAGISLNIDEFIQTFNTHTHACACSSGSGTTTPPQEPYTE